MSPTPATRLPYRTVIRDPYLVVRELRTTDDGFFRARGFASSPFGEFAYPSYKRVFTVALSMPDMGKLPQVLESAHRGHKTASYGANNNFPNTSRRSMRSCAARASRKGKTVSMIGPKAPSPMS